MQLLSQVMSLLAVLVCKLFCDPRVKDFYSFHDFFQDKNALNRPMLSVLENIFFQQLIALDKIEK